MINTVKCFLDIKQFAINYFFSLLRFVHSTFSGHLLSKPKLKMLYRYHICMFKKSNYD